MVKTFLAAQKEIKHAVKDATNPHYKNSYATLESVIDAVKGICNKHGIAITQLNGKDELGHFVETRLMDETGVDLNSKLYLELDKSNMQGLGSAITYARRFALASMFCLAQVDDDAEIASKSSSEWGSFNQPKQQTKGSTNGKSEL